MGPMTIYLNGEKLGEFVGGAIGVGEAEKPPHAAPAPNIEPDLRNDATLMAMVEAAASPGAQTVNGFTGSKSPATAQREAYDLGKAACFCLLQFLADNGQLQTDSRSARYARPGAAPEPPCRCASPTVHEAGCAWKAWKDGQK